MWRGVSAGVGVLLARKYKMTHPGEWIEISRETPETSAITQNRALKKVSGFRATLAAMRSAISSSTKYTLLSLRKMT